MQGITCGTRATRFEILRGVPADRLMIFQFRNVYDDFHGDLKFFPLNQITRPNQRTRPRTTKESKSHDSTGIGAKSVF